MNPKYPIYTISKGRWESRKTAKALDRMFISYKIVIEPQEYDNYANVINKEKILTLPFSNLGQGSIPARNWVWEHSIKTGAKRHWILDDNINAFYRWNKNKQYEVKSGSSFRAIEDWVDRYENVPMAGMHYLSFCPRKESRPPIKLNTRIYSCILLDNNIKHRWRGKYNEDTDLSLRLLKEGYCTACFNAFPCEKQRTMTMKGGNTESLYEVEDGRLKMSRSLQNQHPDVATITWKYGRWTHQVNYSLFKSNKLIKKQNLNIPKRTNNYNMVLANA